jgi:hypothetical protein
MRIISCERDNVAPKDCPEGIDDKTTNKSAMEEALYIGVASGIAVDARTEPCKETYVYMIQVRYLSGINEIDNTGLYTLASFSIHFLNGVTNDGDIQQGP